tara:strand:- start:455 stop:619 length:165 start_codon:yes stop_codon:yes gene_type:complete
MTNELSVFTNMLQFLQGINERVILPEFFSISPQQRGDLWQLVIVKKIKERQVSL